MGRPSRHRRMRQRGVGQVWGDADLGSQKQRVGGGPKSLSLQHPAPPELLRNVWSKGAGEGMGRGTYHIQGLPVGVGKGAKGGKKTRLRK